MTFCDYDMIW